MRRNKTDAAPAVIGANHRVADVVLWYPATRRVLERFGLTGFGQDLLSRVLFREVTVADAASAAATGLEDLLSALNDELAPADARAAARPADRQCKGCGKCTCGGRWQALDREVAQALAAEAWAKS